MGGSREGERERFRGRLLTNIFPQPRPFSLGPQFLHLGQREGLKSTDLGGPSHSDVLNLGGKWYWTWEGGQCGHVAMVTGTEGYPGLSGLASCPEAALVTLDTKAEGGRIWRTRDSTV